MVQYQNGIQRVSVDAVAENHQIAMVLDQANRQSDFDVLKDNEQKLKDIVSRLEMSVREGSQKADATDTGAASVFARCSIEVAKAKAETTSQQDIPGRKIDEMAVASGEKILKYTTQISVLHDEVLRLQSRSENKSEARSSKDDSPQPHKGSFSCFICQIDVARYYQCNPQHHGPHKRMSALSDRVDRSGERASST